MFHIFFILLNAFVYVSNSPVHPEIPKLNFGFLTDAQVDAKAKPFGSWMGNERDDNPFNNFKVKSAKPIHFSDFKKISKSSEVEAKKIEIRASNIIQPSQMTRSTLTRNVGGIFSGGSFIPFSAAQELKHHESKDECGKESDTHHSSDSDNIMYCGDSLDECMVSSTATTPRLLY